jgi:hypothetical protein
MSNSQVTVMSKLHHDNDEHHEKSHHLLGDILNRDAHDRPKALLDLMLRSDQDMTQLWPIVGKIWRCTESNEVDLSECSNIWTEIWSMDGDRSLAMKKGEREHLAQMPDKFVVWQGGTFSEVTHGLSWTRCMETVYSDALRIATVEKPGIVVWGQLERSKILAYFNRGGRPEFVAVPADVKIISHRSVRVRAIDDCSRWKFPSSND